LKARAVDKAIVAGCVLFGIGNHPETKVGSGVSVSRAAEAGVDIERLVVFDPSARKIGGNRSGKDDFKF
jgi:hypothetical protein